MAGDIVVEMMSSEFIVWRCLHKGPLTKSNIDQPNWDRFRETNLPFLAKMIEVYGSCAVVARGGNQIIGHLRFYPNSVCAMAAPGPALCLQEPFPSGPANDFLQNAFPPLDQISDKTLFVHCMMVGTPNRSNSTYQRKGLASRMVRALIEWATRNGWRAIEAHAYVDLPCIYAITGQAGKTFWDKLGFKAVESMAEPAFSQSAHEGFVKALLKEAADRAIDTEAAKTKYTMRLDLI